MLSSAAENLAQQLRNAADKLDSSDPADVIEGLNTLTRKSQEYDAGGILLDMHVELSTALSSLLDVVNPLGCFYYMQQDMPPNVGEGGAFWTVALPSRDDGAFKVCCFL